MGGIAGQSQTRRNEGAGQCEAKRKCAPVRRRPDRAQLVTEAPFELSLENQIVRSNQPVGILCPLGPDERRAIALEGQDRKRTGRQKMLFGNAVMRALMFDGGHDAGLAILPGDRLDAGKVPKFRAHAIASDDEPC